MKNLSYFLVLAIVVGSCSSGKGTMFNKKDIDLKSLIGTWQRKNEQKFEKWALVSPTECIGVAYDMSTGVASIEENMRLFKVDNTWIFEVKHKEHEFKPVQFGWQPDPAFRMRFVNEKNDYPQVIRYKVKSDSTMTADISDIKGGNLVMYDFIKAQKK